MDIKAPVFIMGFPRSGTTVVAHAICANPQFYGGSLEGHFFYLLAPIFDRYLEGTLHPSSLFNRDPVTSMMADNVRSFFFNALEAFYGAQPGRHYVDKTPGIDQIESIPFLLKLYPSASIIFCFREPLSCIESNVRNWPERVNDLQPITYQWIELMRKWREMRELLNPRCYAEIYQADSPKRIAKMLVRPLRLTHADAKRVATFLKTEVVNTPFYDRRPPPLFNASQRHYIEKTVAEEWQFWKPWKRALQPEWWLSRAPYSPKNEAGDD